MLVLLGNSEVCKLSPFLLLTSFTCYLLLAIKVVKGIKHGRKKTGIPSDSNFISRVYDYSVAKNVFLNQ